MRKETVIIIITIECSLIQKKGKKKVINIEERKERKKVRKRGNGAKEGYGERKGGRGAGGEGS